MRKVAIIGAGAAGMTAAITAASNGAEVVVLEHMDRVGKKILSTGNGRCNFTNTYQDRSCYHSDNESFPWKIIEKFNAEQIIKLFEEPLCPFIVFRVRSVNFTGPVKRNTQRNRL